MGYHKIRSSWLYEEPKKLSQPDITAIDILIIDVVKYTVKIRRVERKNDHKITITITTQPKQRRLLPKIAEDKRLL